MNIEKQIADCKYYLEQIYYFNPDPFYVNYFFEEYIESVIKIYDGIFEEASRDFGLFVSGKCTKEKFEKKAVEKNDQLALNFVSWFKENYKNQHDRSYSNFIKKITYFFKENKHLPKINIKIVANQRYKDDVFQLIQVGLTNGKIRSTEELKIEIKRQTPVFLEIINQKRKNKNEPKVHEKQVIATTFLEMENYEDIEISQACETYLPVMKRFLDESRNEIKVLTTWVD